jgi:hypothetical protein
MIIGKGSPILDPLHTDTVRATLDAKQLKNEQL